MGDKLEIEIKLRTDDAVRRLRDSGLRWEVEIPRHFEENWLLDTHDGQMAGRSSAIRVRIVGQNAWVTYKGPPAPQSRYKVREELETQVLDGHTMLAIFERLGFRRAFSYQKWRTVYRLFLPDGSSLRAMVDDTPLGQYLELEGERPHIDAVAGILGYGPDDYITKSYIALQAEACRQAGRPLTDMVF